MRKRFTRKKFRNTLPQRPCNKLGLLTGQTRTNADKICKTEAKLGEDGD